MKKGVQVKYRYLLLGKFIVSRTGENFHFIITQSDLLEHLRVLGQIITISGIQQIVILDLDKFTIVWNAEESGGYFEKGRYIEHTQPYIDWIGLS